MYTIYGIKNGFTGLKNGEYIELSPINTEHIHTVGGSFLGTSRGGTEDIIDIVDSIEILGINQLYAIGGDGTQQGILSISKEIEKRNLFISIVGIPKTIDNDIPIIDRSFGFDTAVEEAQKAIHAAYIEASSCKRGVGVVKLMGRYSGDLALRSSFLSRYVDCCIIPEDDVCIETLVQHINSIINKKGFVMIVVAEGFGQEYLQKYNDNNDTYDSFGNRLLKDIGSWFINYIKINIPDINVKYIEPSYMIRAVPANASDSFYCTVLAQFAVHGVFSGYTEFMVGLLNNKYVFIPLDFLVNNMASN